jgi:O-antigen ligase
MSSLQKSEKWIFSKKIFAFPLIFTISYLIIFLNPFLDSSTETYTLLRRIALSIIFISSIVLLASKITSSFSMVLSSWSHVLFIIYVALSATWAVDYLIVLRTDIYFIGTFLVALSTIHAFDGNEDKFIGYLGILLAIFILASVASVRLFPDRALNDEGRWIGVTAHPNVLGFICILTVWCHLTIFLYSKRTFKKIVGLIFILIAGLCLIKAHSITSIIVSLIVLCNSIFFKFLVGKKGVWRSGNLVKIYVCFFVFFLFILTLQTSEDFLNERTFFKITGRTTTLTGRTGMWIMASEAIKESPLFGFGFLEKIKLAPYSYVTHLHNGYLDTAIRGGLIGLSFILFFIIKLFINLVRISLVESKIPMIIFPLFLAIVLHNITEGSFGRGMNIPWLIFSILYIYSNIKVSNKPTKIVQN